MKRLCSIALLLSFLLMAACSNSSSNDNPSDATSTFEGSFESSLDDPSSQIDSKGESSADFESSEVSSSEESSITSTETYESIDNTTNDVESETDNDSQTTSSVVDDSTSEQENSSSNSDADLPVQQPDGTVFDSNGIIIAGTRGMEQFYGSEASASKYSEYVAAFKNDLGDDVNVYSVVAPTASCLYAPQQYSNLLKRGQVIFGCLSSNATNFTHIDTLGVLSEHVDEAIYPRTEHHWNCLAAYYAAEAFAKSAGVPFDTIDTCEEIVKPGFVGTLYSFSGKCSVLKNNPEDFVIYKPTSTYTAYFCNQGNYNFDKYNYTRDSVVFDVKSYPGAFLGGDGVSVKIVTGNNTGRKLVIFKDSYGNAFVPYTVGSFDEVYVLDIRYYNQNGVRFCKNVGATDVAFVVSAFTAAGVVYKNIEKIRTAP